MHAFRAVLSDNSALNTRGEHSIFLTSNGDALLV